MRCQLLPQRRVYTVSELNAAIRGILDQEFPDVWVAGEISGTKLATSGHYYFTLKERDSAVALRLLPFHAPLPQIQAAGWRSRGGTRAHRRL